MFNYSNVKLDLHVSNNSIRRFSSDELHLLDLSLLGSLYNVSNLIVDLFRYGCEEKDFLHAVSEFDTYCTLYDLMFSEARGDDYSKSVFDVVSQAKIIIFQFKKNHNILKHSHDHISYKDLIKQEFTCEAN